MPLAHSDNRLATPLAIHERGGNVPQPNTPLALGHVGFTVPRSVLIGGERRRIVDFFSICFGVDEVAHFGQDGELLVLALGRVDRFVILFADDAPMAIGKWHQDHCALVCSSIEEFHARAGVVRAYAAREPGCNFEDLMVEDVNQAGSSQPAYRVHKVYVRPAGLPLAFELQHWEDLTGQDDRGCP